jgi:hypothetical protein
MASRRAGISDRILIAGRRRDGVIIGSGRPPGVNSGRWISFEPFLPVWVRLGRRSSWPDEDIDAEMITPVKPPRTRKHGT